MAEREPSSGPAAPSPRSSVPGKAGLMVVSKAVTIIVQLSTLMVLARVLTREDLGYFNFVLLAYSTVSTLAQAGLPDSVFYFFERVPRESRKSFALLTGRTLLQLAAGGSLLLLAVALLAPAWGYPVGALLVPLIFLALLELPTLPMPNVLIAMDRTSEAAGLIIVNSTLQFTAVVVPALLGYSLQVVINALVIYGLLRLALSAVLFRRAFPTEAGPLPPGMAGEQISYSLPLAAAQILWGLNRQVDKYIVAFFFPATVFAVYSIGAWEIPLIPSIAYSVCAVMMPQLVSSHLKGSREELLSLWRQIIRKISIIVLPLTFIFLVAAEEFIVVLFSSEYIEAALPFRIYTLILFQRVASYSSMHRAIGNTRVITVTALFLLGINLGLSIPFVMVMGIAGPPTATLLANLFTWYYSLKVMSRSLKVSFRQVFPLGFYGRTLATSALSAVPSLLLKVSVDASPSILLLMIVAAYIATYALFARISGVVRTEDWRFVFRGLLP